MFNIEDIEIWDTIKIDTSSYNKYIWLAKVVKKSEWDWRSDNSLCIWIIPLEKCFQTQYWIKPKEIIEIENSDKYKDIVFRFIKL